MYCTDGHQLLYLCKSEGITHLSGTKAKDHIEWLKENGDIILNKKVIGYYICNGVDWWGKCKPIQSDSYNCHHDLLLPSCLTADEILKYKGSRENIAAMDIENFVLFDEPKEVSEFFKEGDCEGGLKCKTCPYFEKGNEAAGLEDDCIAPFDTTERIPITRPPQSWCYVEELSV